MDWIDWLILAIVVASTIFGLFRGLIHEVISIVSWIAAFLIAKLLLVKTYELLAPYIENDSFRWVLAWMIPFTIVMIIAAALRFILKQLIDSTGLGGLNNLMGSLIATWGGLSDAFIPALAGGFLAIVAQIGDLAESAIKRKFEVKDSSHIIPGHGGLLDRLDGVIAVAPTLVFVNWISGGKILIWQ